MVHARVVRQPNRGAAIAAIDEQAIKRAAKAPVEFVRNGNFLAIVGNDETAVDLAGAAAAKHVTWQHVETPTSLQAEASWLMQRPAIDRHHRRAGAGRSARPRAVRGDLYRAAISRMPRSRRPAAWRVYRDSHLTVWTHCQGVFPLRAALARTLGLDASAITVHHVQGSGCYGHNGADDAAADAAIIAMKMPGKPIRVRWRREEEFVYEPKSPAMVVKVRALLDDAGQARRLDARKSGAARTIIGPARAAICWARKRCPIRCPSRRRATCRKPMAAAPRATASRSTTSPAKRIIHHLVTETPVRTSALRGLGAMPNVFAIECAIDELAERAGEDPVQYRLSIIVGPTRAQPSSRRSPPWRGWKPGEPGGAGRGRGIGFARYKNRAAYAAVVVELDVEEDDPAAACVVRERCRARDQSRRRDQPARRRHHPVGELGAQGAGPLRQTA